MVSLNLTWCVRITDKSIVEGIGQLQSKLQLLGLFGNTNITDKAYNCVKNNHNDSLRTIDFYGCVNISENLRTNENLMIDFPKSTKLIYHS